MTVTSTGLRIYDLVTVFRDNPDPKGMSCQRLICDPTLDAAEMFHWEQCREGSTGSPFSRKYLAQALSFAERT